MTSNAEPVTCEADDLARFTREILQAIGMRPPDARDMAAQIVGSELAGHESHGLRRLAEYVKRAENGQADPGASSVIDLDRGSLLRVDGRRGFGHITVRDATNLAVERAIAHGIAAVAVHNCDYAGRFADFCEAAAAAGVATVMFVNDAGAGQVVAPPGGREGRMSTNPVAAGIPHARSPHLVIDMATSTVAMGRLSEWRDRGEETPAGWLNEHGVLQFFAGAKGFGLALIAEALGGALTTAGTVSSRPADDRQGALIIAIHVDGLRPLQEFTDEVEAFTRHVKDTPVGVGAPPVRVPGEGSAATTETRRTHGVPIQRFTWQVMAGLADRLQVTLPTRRPAS